ncbi:MAG: hypothetical protein Q4C98_02665 [Capnocytophaga sp.]|nr:hypothetical protein [Capnocytophaga sp.]
MLRFKKQMLIFASVMVGLLLTVACNKNETTYATPSLSIEGDVVVDLAPNENTKIKLSLNGDGGAKSVVVNKNGGFLKQFPIHATAKEFIYTTEPVPSGMEEGDEIKYSFILVNENNVDSAEIPVVIKVSLHNKISVGNNTLYSLNIGTDGVVASGQKVKLITGRNYFVPTNLTFEAGSSLTIEEGVQVYMNAEATDKVGFEISGEVNIAGTATNPVVITSSKVLTDATAAAAGDWGRFVINGSGNTSNSGKISYLRLEYGGDRTFRLLNVGAATEFDHIQVFQSSGEGFMFTDGNAELKYLVATNCQGGSFRLGEQYEGKIQFALSVNTERFDENDDFTIRENAKPVIANVTLVGAGENVPNTHGMRMRGNAAPKIYNTIIAHYPRRGLRADDNVNISDLNGDAVFAHSYIFNVKTDPFRGLAKTFAGTFDSNGSLETNPFYNNATALINKVYTLETIAGIGVADFIPDTEQVSDFDPASLGTFFTSAKYVGAIKNAAEDWTKGWVKTHTGAIRN